MNLKDYATKSETVERMTLVFPFSERAAIAKALDEGGWWVRRSGPYTDSKMYPKVDMTRSLYEIEREIESK